MNSCSKIPAVTEFRFAMCLACGRAGGKKTEGNGEMEEREVYGDGGIRIWRKVDKEK